MIDKPDITLLSVSSLSSAFRDGVASPVDALEAFTKRIKKYNPRLNAFLDLRLGTATSEARDAGERWRTGKPLSPIDGVPFGVKANIAVKGMPWHGGVAAYRETIAEADAVCVAFLRSAGAIPIGMLNMHEGALGATTDNPHFGRCYNPWGENLTPGGSSGGSGAAVAARLCAFSLGTDTMGSVRIPSAYCGVTGFKPSYGNIPTEGLVALSPTLDHIGPHARHASDLKLIMTHLTKSAFKETPENIHFGLTNWKGAVDVSPAVAAAFSDACEYISEIGQVETIDLKDFDFDFGALRRRGLLVSEVEGYETHKDMLGKDPEGFSEEFRGMLEWGARQSSDKIDKAYGEIRAAGERLNKLFDDVDVLVTPTTPQKPFAFSASVPANQADFTCIANFAGAPAVAVPATVEGEPPASIQFIARKGFDHIALAAAEIFESARGSAPSP